MIGPRTRARGYYTKADFLELVTWKARRVASRAAKNPASAIEEVTRVALGASTEELRIWAPQVPSGHSGGPLALLRQRRGGLPAPAPHVTQACGGQSGHD